MLDLSNKLHPAGTMTTTLLRRILPRFPRVRLSLGRIAASEQTDLNTSEPTLLASSKLASVLTPKEIVERLDKNIIGQDDAKRSVAIALRNRWRRQTLAENFRKEVIPKNILMIGPTGVGKTEIARRLAVLSEAPFIKVEATKFTEVGFHGRDVDMIIRDLVEVAIKDTKRRLEEQNQGILDETVEKQLLEYLLGESTSDDQAFAESMETALKNGELEERKVRIPVVEPHPRRILGGADEIREMNQMIQGFLGKLSPQPVTYSDVPLKEARQVLKRQEMEKHIQSLEGTVLEQALESVEQSGIVFIDEIDKIVQNNITHHGPDASAEGVQRDLLPLIEGSAVSTTRGDVKTDHILFICSGAFSAAKPSDMLAELQGRLPLRVELHPLTHNDLVRVLTETEYNLLDQTKALLAAEGVDLSFTPEAVDKIAEIASNVNKEVENIGARRLHAVLEHVVEEISFSASDQVGEKIVISQDYVEERMKDTLMRSDIAKYIL